MEIPITKISVLTNYDSTDQITLYTLLPPAFPKCFQDPAHMTIEVQKGTGIEYALEHFKMDIEVIHASTGKKEIIKYVDWLVTR